MSTKLSLTGCVQAATFQKQASGILEQLQNNPRLLAGLAGAGLGGAVGYMASDDDEIDEETGRRKKRNKLLPTLLGAGLGGLGGAGLMHLYRGMQNPAGATPQQSAVDEVLRDVKPTSMSAPSLSSVLAEDAKFKRPQGPVTLNKDLPGILGVHFSAGNATPSPVVSHPGPVSLLTPTTGDGGPTLGTPKTGDLSLSKQPEGGLEASLDARLQGSKPFPGSQPNDAGLDLKLQDLKLRPGQEGAYKGIMATMAAQLQGFNELSEADRNAVANLATDAAYAPAFNRLIRMGKDNPAALQQTLAEAKQLHAKMNGPQGNAVMNEVLKGIPREQRRAIKEGYDGPIRLMLYLLGASGQGA